MDIIREQMYAVLIGRKCTSTIKIIDCVTHFGNFCNLTAENLSITIFVYNELSIFNTDADLKE